MSAVVPSPENVKVHFAQLAVQYYIAGRTAALHQSIPVLGNLLHHAVEMSLKAALAANHSLSQLKDLGHGLPRLWRAFAAAYPAAALPRFEVAVTALHRFEDLRYPDSALASGAAMQLVLHRAHAVSSGPDIAGVPNYQLVLEDVDELQESIFAAMNLNPQFLSGSLSTRAKAHLLEHNLHGSRW
jgi:hypothetical protein